MTQTNLTWEEIVDIWLSKGASYKLGSFFPGNLKEVVLINRFSDGSFSDGENTYMLSPNDVLFGASNFFKAMFGDEITEVNVGDFVLRSVDRKGVDKGYIEHSKYRKMICAGCEDKLAYLNFALQFTEEEDETRT